MDDVGASSKEFELYSKKLWGLGNFLFLKRIRPFAAWGPYQELTVKQWQDIFNLLERKNARMTVGITAAWVDFEGGLTPFPVKFPAQAAILRDAQKKGIIEIANHGLTHCVLESHSFRPKLFRGNRKFHREFWPWLDKSLHYEHVQKSQDILENYFQTKIETLIPPGNVFADSTLEAAEKHGIKFVNCNVSDSSHGNLKIISNENVIAFHDKELVEFGTSWLENILEKNSYEWVFVKELA